jgi:hypothetical protein
MSIRTLAHDDAVLLVCIAAGIIIAVNESRRNEPLPVGEPIGTTWLAREGI